MTNYSPPFPSKLIVDAKAIENNIRYFRKKKPHSAIMGIVKGNAYAVGTVNLAKILEKEQVDFLGVAHLTEALLLKKNHIKSPIFIIFSPLNTFETIIERRFHLAVNSIEELKELEKQAKKQKKKALCHLNLNTGINRFGCSKENAFELCFYLQNSPHLSFEGFFSHLTSSETEEEDPFTLKQYQVLSNFLYTLHKKNIYPKWVHLANTAGALRFDFPLCNLLRIGIGLIGAKTIKKSPLTPALTLKTTISHTHNVIKGDSIGYNRKCTITKDKAKVAIIPLGYQDGLLTSFSPKGYVMINQKKAPILGPIFMDFTVVDITDNLAARQGSEVTLFGNGCNTIESFCSQSNVFIYEFLSSIGNRVERKIINLNP